MKSLVDNFVSCIVFVVILFGITSFSVVEMQIMTARHIHTSVVNQVQSSYYKVDIGAINDKLYEQFPTWEITSTEVNSVNDRQDRLIKLRYQVVLPMFGLTKEGVIDGYAR